MGERTEKTVEETIVCFVTVNKKWHMIDIPMSDIASEVDLSEVSQLFQVLGLTGPISDIGIDDICFTGGDNPRSVQE